MAKISLEDLNALLSDLEVDEAELRQYFVLDEDNARAFQPRFKLNPDTVRIPRGAEGDARSAAAMNGANWFARMNRRAKFFKKLRKGYTGPVIVSEGDSWFQYPILLKDTIDWLMEDYAVMSLGAAGDLLERMANKQEYLGALKEYNAEILLLSGGGNDLVAAGALASHLEAFDPALAPEDYLLPSFQALLDDALMHYERMFTQVRQALPHVSILCHGYDYPVPNDDKWLGKPMASRGIKDKGLQKSIAKSMMDQFNRRLRRLSRAMPHVTYIDCRGVVRDDRWHDGLHPTDEGYKDVAKAFKAEIKKLANSRSGPPFMISGPFGHAPALAAAQPEPQIAGGAGTGYSLHLGLNLVDPAHYSGWDGALKACEADAHAMEALAQSQGFKTQKMLTKQATRAKVVKAIEDVAGKAKAGDMFLFTVSAHGGTVPDFNKDEDHDGDQMMDETLCLYDFQLADDELYMLWDKFEAGVRILMVPDTCHSGSMVRAGPSRPAMLFGRPVAPVVEEGLRAMPPEVADRVWRDNEAAYRNASDSYSAFKESVMTHPLDSPIKASVLNLGACKDEQFAQDGTDHGAFTGALLKVWNNGAFSGGYRAFRDAIDAEIGSHRQTPQLFEALVKTPNFVEDKPFQIQSTGPQAARPAPADLMTNSLMAPDADEGDEIDTISDAEVQAIYDRQMTGVSLRSATAARSWSLYGAFDDFIKSLGLAHFSTDEFLILGGSHNTPGGKCAGKNTFPPKDLWGNIAKTAQALDTFRARIGKPVAITNAYRGPAYNACIGGAKASQHMKFCALDFKVSGMAAPDVAMALRVLRDREGLFVGGIGRYNSFTHVDTRGVNATWPKSFRDSAVPGSLGGV